MSDNITVLPGSGHLDLEALSAVAGDFGWAVDTAADLYQVAALQERRDTVAVLFSRDALDPNCSWLETISLLRIALPSTRLVVCQGFSDSTDWAALCEAGAFHSLWLPLKETEVRRSLGFLWQSRESRNRLDENVSSFVSSLDSAECVSQRERSQNTLPSLASFSASLSGFLRAVNSSDGAAEGQEMECSR
jgi:hypothetical protein